MLFSIVFARTELRSVYPACPEPRSAKQHSLLWSAFPRRRPFSVRSGISFSQAFQLSNLPTFKRPPVPSRDEKPHVSAPLVPADCKCPLPQTLSLHILTNAPGVWGSTLPFLKSYLNSNDPPPLPRKRPFPNPLFSIRCALFQVPYPATPACLSAVAGHSYANFASRTVLRDENCRVCTNNSHSGSPTALAAKGTPFGLVTSLPRYFLTSLSHQSPITAPLAPPMPKDGPYRDK